MKFKNAKIRMLDLDLKGCIYLNTFSRSKRVAHFFKLVSRLGDGVFWYAMLAAVWLLQGLLYGLQMLYLIISSLAGTGIYKVLKKKTVRPRPYQVHQVIRLGGRAPAGPFQLPFRAYPACSDGDGDFRLCAAGAADSDAAVYRAGGAVAHGARAALSQRCGGGGDDWRGGGRRDSLQRAPAEHCAVNFQRRIRQNSRSFWEIC